MAFLYFWHCPKVARVPQPRANVMLLNSRASQSVTTAGLDLIVRDGTTNPIRLVHELHEGAKSVSEVFRHVPFNLAFSALSPITDAPHSLLGMLMII